MTTSDWIPHDGGPNPVREGETLVGYKLRFRNGTEREHVYSTNWPNWPSSKIGSRNVTHYRVSPPRVGEPATMSADEVLIRAREAVIAVWNWTGAYNAETRRGDYNAETRRGDNDNGNYIQAIIAYERDRAKPLAEVAPHTAEDPDDRAAYDVCLGLYRLGTLVAFADWRASPLGRSVIAGIKRGRELERGA